MTADDPALAVQGRLDAYAALAAHQLGEAVALMRGASTVLNSQSGRPAAGGDDALRALNAGADRAQRFVDDLLDLVRASGEATEQPPTDLDAALDAATLELGAWLHRSDVSLRREPLPQAGLGAQEAERLFVHLLRSAMAAGAGRVQITPAADDGDAVILEVLDDGAPPRDGVDPFEPFERPRGRGPLVGAGMSLVICRRLVARRGGSIGLADGGDRVLVTVRLPAD
jgi:signal transduction histidine kinase